MAGEQLTLPHPGITDRNFVLLPWAEITPHYYVPGLATVAQLVRSVVGKAPEIERLE
jgi:2-amino-4-hydroxy-6-hydroxymethyldihydropteridine diphosphokinase